MAKNLTRKLIVPLLAAVPLVGCQSIISDYSKSLVKFDLMGSGCWRIC